VTILHTATQSHNWRKCFFPTKTKPPRYWRKVKLYCTNAIRRVIRKIDHSSKISEIWYNQQSL
jgi:hypothetical protein